MYLYVTWLYVPSKSSLEKPYGHGEILPCFLQFSNSTLAISAMMVLGWQTG
jgi:hypothetical protein